MSDDEYDDVVRLDCITRLRHLGNEYREARRLPSFRAFLEMTKLDLIAVDVVQTAWHTGYLTDWVFGIVEIANPPMRPMFHLDMSFDKALGASLFKSLAGYDVFDQVEIIVPAYTKDELGLVRKIEVETYSYYLRSGWLCERTGYSEFQPIDVGEHVIDAESRFELLLDHIFEIMGYRGLACDIIAKVLDEKAEDKSIEPDDRFPEDGLYRSDALLIWGGVRYEWLTETMMDAIELLVKRYPEKVRPSEMEHKIGPLPQDGFKAIFKVSRIGQPPKHPVEKLVEGRAPAGWYLTK
jgi:hypothetical protein